MSTHRRPEFPRLFRPSRLAIRPPALLLPVMLGGCASSWGGGSRLAARFGGLLSRDDVARSSGAEVPGRRAQGGPLAEPFNFPAIRPRRASSRATLSATPTSRHRAAPSAMKDTQLVSAHEGTLSMAVAAVW